MRVGTSACNRLRTYPTMDHPHACGDKKPLKICSTSTKGSSPCVWGQERNFKRLWVVVRIIPMRVGTSFFYSVENCTVWDHPHACGDKKRVKVYRHISIGSSPCVWGQDEVDEPTYTEQRIIPMRVGTRSFFVSFSQSTQDHPHACGDKQQDNVEEAKGRGSSPCVWGQAKVEETDYGERRIIPMRVGTRLKKSRKIAVLQNQPLRFPLTFHRSFV